MKIIPASRPQATVSQLLRAAENSWGRTLSTDPLPKFFVFAFRGYYLKSMGNPNTNDIGIYDDAVFVVGPDTFKSFNANTDPSRNRNGMATLLPGWHKYRPGNHGISRPGGGYPAFRPANPREELPVRRFGYPMSPHPRAGVAINIHSGGDGGTSSEGCQTIPPSQWIAFQALVMSELRKHSLKEFWYGLTENEII